MKILAISALHPPYHSGGYELRVKNILDGLAERGHSIRVLTNQPDRKAGKRAETSPYPVLRNLHDRYKARFFPRELLIDLQDTATLEKQIAEFQPDVVYIGHLHILSKALLPFLARQIVPIVYDEGGSGLIDGWNDHGRWFRFTGEWRSRFAPFNWFKPAVIRTVCWLSQGRIKSIWNWPLNMNIFFNSQLNYSNALSNGVPVEGTVVIHSGIDPQLFEFTHRQGLENSFKILVPGRIERRKGQKDAVELIRILRESGFDAQLTLAGGGWVDGYQEEVFALINENKLEHAVEIVPMLTTAKLIKEYQTADICFFPSYFRTGFSRVPLEAMACGCIVISYGNEGSDEVIHDQENGYLVNSGDINQVVWIIKKILRHPADAITMVTIARQNIVDEFSFDKYIDQIEEVISTATKTGKTAELESLDYSQQNSS